MWGIASHAALTLRQADAIPQCVVGLSMNMSSLCDCSGPAVIPGRSLYRQPLSKQNRDFETDKRLGRLCKVVHTGRASPHVIGMRRFELTDAQWEQIAPLLPPQKP
ncbi:hypothetical protein, partial [uncultured Methylobacterium sp.]|uniref:hypothetical protein n=1 Tax=uncultured Methylobacterium sp. TaxID=157278 RepID=UPI0025869752